MKPVPTISVARAAEIIGTNGGVIQEWIQQGKVESVWSEQGYRVLEEPFEQLVKDLTDWLEGCEADEVGYKRACLQDLEPFWKSRVKTND